MPEDPEEILRLYRTLPIGVRLGDLSVQTVRTSEAAGRGAEIGIGLVIDNLIWQSHGVGPAVAFLALWLFVSNLLANWPTARWRLTLVVGPLSGIVSLFENRRAAELEGGGPLDPLSLDVIEPVARYLAEPLLRRAEVLVSRRLPGDEASRIADLMREDAGIEAHLAVENDPVWRAAAEARRGRLGAEVQALSRDFGRAASVRARIYEESEALRRHLDLLTRRRDLLRAIAGEEAVSVSRPARDGGEVLRANLAALTVSLGEGDRLARARLDAEGEMDALERGLGA